MRIFFAAELIAVIESNAFVPGAKVEGNQAKEGTSYGDSDQWWHHC